MKLSYLISSISASADAKLLNLLQSRFHLHTHLQALKKFMLLGQVFSSKFEFENRKLS